MGVLNDNTRLGASGASTTGYTVERSLLFDGDRTTGANQTAPMEWLPIKDGNRQKMTFSAWIRRGQLDKEQYVIQAANTDYPNVNGLRFRTDNKLQFHAGNSYADCNHVTTRTFTDEAAWYHIVFAIDTTQATDTNRFKLYINGVQETNFSTNTKFGQNDNLWLMSTKKHTLGAQSEQGYEYWRMFDGEMADIHFLDGVQLTASSFGEEDSNGTWVPKEYDTADGSYGTNGFFLKFSDVTRPDDIGKDYSRGKLEDAGTNALPILNTSGDYGETATSGNRTDSLSSNLKLALAMNSTTNLTTDLSGNGHNLTMAGTGSNSGFNAGTASSKFYGTSMLSDSSDNMLQTTTATADLAAGTGDFCYEFWFRFEYVYAASGNICHIFDTRHSGMSTAANCASAWWEYGTDYIRFYVAGTQYNIKQWAQRGKWYHGAITRSSGTVACYLDGHHMAGGSNTGDLTSEKITIGRYYGATRAWSGGLQDFRFYKGAAKYTGTDSFTTPTSNDAEVHGLTAVDSTNPENVDIVRDTPNLRHPCLSFQQTRDAASVLSKCGTEIDFTAGNDNFAAYTTHYMKTGKWYYEVRINSNPAAMLVGISPDDYLNGKRCQNQALWGPGSQSGSGIAVQCGHDQHYTGGSNQGSYMGAFSDGDRVMVALDCDNGKVHFGRNGQWADGSGNADESGLTNDAALTIGGTAPFVLGIGDSSASHAVNATLNCGQWPFKHTPPTGYKAINTENIPDPTITTPESFFKAVTYTGDGATSKALTVGFQPDLCWFKCRDSTHNHDLYDSVRGGNKRLIPNETNGEATFSNLVQSFDANGVTVGSATEINGSGDDFVVWNWKAGGSSASNNTDGTVASSVSANTSAGFSIVRSTNSSVTNGNSTFGHGLGVAPDMIISKGRIDVTDNWKVFHKDLTANNNLMLHANDSESTYSNFINDVTSTTFKFHAGNNANDDLLAYCFSSVVGYSKVGKFIGNGSADGPFINCGFAPAWVMYKSFETSESWRVIDNQRLGYNPANYSLFPNVTNVEYTTEPIDLLSNGFKFKNNNGGSNDTDETFIYVAFAEHPFKYANAR